jgi:hypothetical protein
MTREITDGIGAVHKFAPIAITPPETTGARAVERPLSVPSWLPPGQAIYQSTIEFRCNPLQDWWPITVTPPPVRLVVR